jgi:hypothetical protein
MALGTSTTVIRGVIYPPVPVSAIAGITGWVARHWYESTSRLDTKHLCVGVIPRGIRVTLVYHPCAWPRRTTHGLAT